MKVRKYRAALAALTLAALSISSAHADYVQAESPFLSGVPLASLAQGPAGSSINATQLVWGSSLSVNALSLSSAGTLSVKLADIAWPEALSSLSLLVTDLNGLWQRLDGAGELLIDVNGPSKLFAAVFATSGNASTPGLYRLRADFAAAPTVPLPAGVWLLLSGLGGLAALRRKR